MNTSRKQNPRRAFVPSHRPPKGLYGEKDRHGNEVWYFRPAFPGADGKRKRVRIHGEFGSPSFQQAYRDAMYGRHGAAAPAEQEKLSRQDEASLQWLIDGYLVWHDQQSEAKATKKQHKNVLIHVRAKNGDRPFARLDKSNIIALRDAVAAKGFNPDPAKQKPAKSMANRVVAVIRAMFDWAITQKGLLESNPCNGVTTLDYAKKSHHCWTDDQCDIFEAHYLPGTREHLAYVLGMQTGQRCSDIVEMGPHSFDRDGDIAIVQRKTKKPVTIPMTLALKEALDAAKKAGILGEEAFICSEHDGSKITEGHFGNMIRAACDEIGIPKCTAHGMRHAAATRALENGARADELMSIFGFTLPVAAKYVAKFEGKRAAKGAGHLLQRARKAPLKLVA